MLRFILIQCKININLKIFSNLPILFNGRENRGLYPKNGILN